MVDKHSTVVISHAPDMDYRHDYVTLPRAYGTEPWDKRADVQAIRTTVFDNLSTLDEHAHFSDRAASRHVLIKPNLVTVYHNMGLVERDYPESTDPRVLDAVVQWFLQFTRDITIVESSGRGAPTRGSFRVAGIDRLARHRAVGLVALEEQPVDRYILPRARVQKEICIPRIFSGVVTGESFYVSLPKMKTNLYTGVTLGFKNAMGTIPYNLRQRNHNWAIDQKLVDMLYLFKPDLVVIDGIVGAEGNCPAPVEPVDSRVIVSGDNTVEVDRIATRMMGFDPMSIDLIRIANEMGFGDPSVELVGEPTVTPFAPADASLMSDSFHTLFPNVRALVGHEMPNAPHVARMSDVTADLVLQMEKVCRGGCLATTRFAFDMLRFEGLRRDFALTVVIGAGTVVEGTRVWFDRDGKAYTAEEIEHMRGKRLVVGNCASCVPARRRERVGGCMPFPNAPHVALHRLTGTWCRVMSPRNRNLLPLLAATLQECENRRRLLRQGIRLDVPLQADDHLVEPRLLTEAEQAMDLVSWPFPPLTPAEIRQLVAQEGRNVLATFMN
ncbi:MAG: DUF362 domain-containing protein [Caldiserica bacterium]|nr:DUF362 domain-containing protein [Caldisericota bacterium]